VGLPNSFDRFREIWSGDFEFKSDACHRPVPVAFFAKERRTGAAIRMRRAELSCFRELGQPAPRHALCSYAECCAAINGLDIDGLTKKRPKLREACELYGLPHMSADSKAHMIEIILNKPQTEWIVAYSDLSMTEAPSAQTARVSDRMRSGCAADASRGRNSVLRYGAFIQQSFVGIRRTRRNRSQRRPAPHTAQR
jgi:hypothetical protein